MNTNTLSEQDRKTADRKLDRITKLMSEVCSITGQNHLEVEYERIDLTKPAPPRFPQPSHIPTRFPITKTTDTVAIPRNGPWIDWDRIKEAARQWSQKNDFDPAPVKPSDNECQ